MDIRTLLLVNFLFSIASSLIALYTYITMRKRYRGVFFWLLGNIFIGVSAILLATQNILPFFISVSLANFVSVMVPAWFALSLNEFCRLPYRKPIVIAGVALSLTTAILAFFVDFHARVLIHAAFWFILWLVPAFFAIFLLRRDRSIFLGSAFAGFAVVCLLRFIGTLSDRTSASLLTGDIVQQIFMMFLPFFYVLMFIGYQTVIARHIQRLLYNQEAKITIAMEQSPASMVITDTNGIITWVNHSFELITGYSRNEAIGKNPRILKSDKTPKETYTDLWGTITNGNVWKGELVNRKKDGGLYNEKAVISPILDLDGKLISYLAIKEDITREKRLDDFRADVERIMRHDLRTPLTSMFTYLEMLLQNPALDERQQKSLKAIQSSANLLLSQLDHSLDLYKMEEGTYRPALEVFDILETIRKVLADLSKISEGRNLRVSVNCDGKAITGCIPIPVRSDRTLLYRLISNLVKNAFEAPPDGGEVSISINSGDSLVLTIRNQGCIPADIREHFMEKFVTSGKYGGTGLGTYSAKLIAQALGFTLSFETSELFGTILEVRIPRGGPV